MEFTPLLTLSHSLTISLSITLALFKPVPLQTSELSPRYMCVNYSVLFLLLQCRRCRCWTCRSRCAVDPCPCRSTTCQCANACSALSSLCSATVRQAPTMRRLSASPPAPTSPICCRPAPSPNEWMNICTVCSDHPNTDFSDWSLVRIWSGVRDPP